MALPLATVAVAQERAVSGNLQNEASWSALKALVGKTQGDVNVAKIDINAIKNCAAQGKLYTGSGCRDAVIPTDPRLTSILTCGNQGRVYSQVQNACIEVSGGTRWYSARSGPSTGSTSLGGSSTALTRIKNELSKISMPICGSDMSVSRKCSPAGKECATLERHQRQCGSDGDNTCYSYTTQIYRCD